MAELCAFIQNYTYTYVHNAFDCYYELTNSKKRTGNFQFFMFSLYKTICGDHHNFAILSHLFEVSMKLSLPIMHNTLFTFFLSFFIGSNPEIRTSN